MTKNQAWLEVDKLFPNNYTKDEKKSTRAGYDIYVSPGGRDWISDLVLRIEINIEGNTTNIWVNSELSHLLEKQQKTISRIAYLQKEKQNTDLNWVKNYYAERINHYRTELKNIHKEILKIQLK